MSTAAGVVAGLPLQVAPQVVAETAAQAEAGGDFAVVMAAACMTEPEPALPEGMQSAAALAWLAGFGAIVQPQADAPMLDDRAQAELDDIADGSADASAAELSVLQGLLANLVPGGSRESGETSADGAVTGAKTLPGAEDAGAAGAPVVRASNADARPEVAAALTDEAGANSLVGNDGGTSADTPRDAGTGERLVAALAERASLRMDAPGSGASADRNAIAGPSLYANTQEAVGNSAGAASSRPEVVHATVGSPRWANELGSRLAMMSVRGQQEGSLTLTPEHLGPLEVRITLNQDTTNVWFGAQHADTRAALADALPRLREMFAASGLALGQAGVSHEMPRQEARHGEGAAPRVAASAEQVEALPAAQMRLSRGLLDTWA